MATRLSDRSVPRARRAKGEVLHDGFLRHANFRWLRIATIICLVSIASYLLIDVTPRHNGGSWYGYIMGTIGVGLIRIRNDASLSSSVRCSHSRTSRPWPVRRRSLPDLHADLLRGDASAGR